MAQFPAALGLRRKTHAQNSFPAFSSPDRGNRFCRADRQLLRRTKIRGCGGGAGDCGGRRVFRGGAFFDLYRSQPADQPRSALAPARNCTGASLSAARRHDSRGAGRAQSRQRQSGGARAGSGARVADRVFSKRALSGGQRLLPPRGAVVPALERSRKPDGADDRGPALSRWAGAGPEPARTCGRAWPDGARRPDPGNGGAARSFGPRNGQRQRQRKD